MDPANLLTTISSFPIIIIYVVLFVFAFVENVFPPSPGDTFVIIGAVLAGKSLIDPVHVFLITIFGSLISIMIIYYLARLKGRKFFYKKIFYFLTDEKLQKVDDLFARHGEKIIIASRFFVGVRTVVIVMAGIAGVSASRMLLYSAIGVMLWHGILIYAGYALAQNWQIIIDFLMVYNRVFVVFVFIICCAVLLRRLSKGFEFF